MNSFDFVGRLASAPTLTNTGETRVVKFTAISNDYAGKDEATGETLTRTTAIQFTAFNKKAVAIADNFLEGDQIILANVSIQNNNYEKTDGTKVYDYNFIVDDFDFGAPGPKKRDQLANRRA